MQKRMRQFCKLPELLLAAVAKPTCDHMESIESQFAVKLLKNADVM